MSNPELIANSPTPGSVAAIATLASPVSTTPAPGTVETWTFNSAPPAALQAAGQYRFTVDSEICIDVTGGGGSSRQIQRGAEGSTVATHLSGTSIFHGLTAGALTNLPINSGQLPSSVVSDPSGHGTDWGVTKEAPLNPQWATYGAKGDGVTDDTVALQAAINAIPQSGYGRGSEIFLPPGVYLHTGLSFAALHSLTVRGVGGADILAPAELRYTGTGTRGIDCRSAQRLKFKSLSLSYNSGSFTGTLVDFQHNTGGSPPDASLCSFEDCRVGFPVYTIGSPLTSCALAVSWQESIFMTARDSYFQGAGIGIRGINPASIGYSNGHTIDNCFFDNLTVAGIANMGQTCKILGRGEGTVGVGSGLVCFYLDNIPNGNGAITYGLTIEDMWLGDAVNVVNWINFGYTVQKGLKITGGLMTGSSGAAITMLKGINGGLIGGVSFGGPHAIDLGSFSTGLTKGLWVAGNDFTSVTGAPIANLTGHYVNLIGNTPRNGVNQSADQLFVAGHIVTDQAEWVAPTIGASAFGYGALGSTSTASVQGNDTCGIITLVASGTGQAPGDAAQFRYAVAYDGNQQTNILPRMQLTPRNAESAALQPYAYASSQGATTIGVAGTPVAGHTYTYEYFVAQ